MNADRLLTILGQLAAASAADDPAALCRVAVEVTGLGGVSVALFAGEAQQAAACSSDPVAADLDELQYTTGEGPTVDAHRSGRPVGEPDLASPQSPRWPAFAPAAVAVGARAVFAFPLCIGAIRLGVITLHREQPGALRDDQHVDALAMADVAARHVLAQRAASAPGASITGDGIDFHLVVHQAAGMVSVQLDVDLAEALVRLRAHAFAVDESLTSVAEAVVDRSLRFRPSPEGGGEPGGDR
ncbi:MAG TPA: ANTAR domain-containing protein [Acidimicrobiales bacterium]|nr:ANTAR domain-containing protein [Acidimicrobiales bacterium]